MRTLFNSSLFRSQEGQGGLIAVAVTILIGLVLGATTLNGLSLLNAQRTIVMKQNLQTYYAAQAGIQEALATRMVPRSNYLNFNSVITPFYSRSGKIYTDPSKISNASSTQDLVSLYRYVVIGGDSARKADGTYYSSASNADKNPAGLQRIIATETMPTSSSFVIFSNALSCVSVKGRAIVTPGQLVVSPTPTCKDSVNYRLDEITLVAQAQLAGEYTGSNKPLDKVTKLRAYKDNTKLRLPLSAFVPGYGWMNNSQDIDFNKVWAYNVAANANEALNPLKLERVVFYNFADNKIFYDQPVTSNQVTVSPKISAKAAIRLYFNGPFDYRSISPSYERNLTDCQGNGANTCGIRVMQSTDANGNNGTVYKGNTMIPLFPGGTQVILLPPLTGTINGGGVRHTIRVDASRMTNYSSAVGPKDYKIIFTTQ